MSSLGKVTIRQLENELHRRKRVDPLKLAYKPHDAQIRVHGNRASITLVLGGNRTGKTWCAVAEALYYCLGRSTWAEVPDAPVTVWYILPTSGQFVRNIEPIIDTLMPMDEVKHVNNQSHIYKFNNGSDLHFLSADQKQRRLAGASVDLVIIDEPIPETIFKELQARTIDCRGRILMVMTPVDDKPDNWIWVRDKLFIPFETGERRDIDVVYMPVADVDGNSLVPHLDNEDIQLIVNRYPDPLDRAARMYGHFVTKAGLVFGMFHKKIHVIKRFDFPDTWTRWIVVDPQYYRFACIFMAADPDGNYYITDEYYSQEEPLAYRAQRIKAILGEVDKAVPCYVDSANPQDIAELNYHFNRTGAKIGATKLPMQKRIDQMVLRVHSMLEPMDERKYNFFTDRRNISGAPRLLFFDDLISTWYEGDNKIQASRLMWEIQRLTWKNDKPDKNSAGGSDMMDALIYGCSILAVGVETAEQIDRYKDMSDVDAEIHRIMDRSDLAIKRQERWRWAN